MDPKKETQHLDKHDEVAGQFDYTHSQANELDKTPPPPQQQKKPVNALLFNPKYWLSIVGVTVLYLVVVSYFSTLLTYVILVIMLVFVFLTIAKIKKRGKDEPTQSDKYKMVVFMTFVPLIGQAIYYYSLRRTMPRTASIALKIGWQVLVLFATAVVIYTFITVTGSWQYQYGAQFQGGLDSITSDLNAITADAKEFDSASLTSNCNKLSTDIDRAKQVPPNPETAAQEKVTAALDLMKRGANDCTKSLIVQDPDLLKKSNSELNQGFHELQTAVNLMKV